MNDEDFDGGSGRGRDAARVSRVISDDVFRILSLRSEEQCEQEVVKPVLEELEVMRLSCGLGALSSVNARDFELQMLEAYELDAEFARFLRRDVFRTAHEECDDGGESESGSGNNNNGSEDKSTENQVRVLSLFGTQREVKRELGRLNCWSSECDARLHAMDQGIYCVKRTQASLSTSSSSKQHKHELVVFAWLHDALFEPQRLRGTATYILRFLTCLSSSVVCCLSAADVEKIQDIVSDMESSGADDWNSYSVALCVEKQQDENDQVCCEPVNGVGVDASPNEYKLQLTKGSYPALMTLIPDPTETRTENSSMKFRDVVEFARWMEPQFAECRVELMFRDPNTMRRCQYPLLRAADRVPKDTICTIDGKYEQRCRQRSVVFIEEQRERLHRESRQIFTVEGLSDRSELLNSLKELKRDQKSWYKVDGTTRSILHLPNRLAFHFHLFYKLFVDGDESELESLLKKIVATRASEFAREINQKRWSLIKWTKSWFRSEAQAQEAFRRRMILPLDIMKIHWLEAVDCASDTLRCEL